MNAVMTFVACAGGFCIIAGQIWAALLVMRNSPLLALACLLLPCMLPYFVISTWPDAKKPFLLWLAGIALAMCATSFVK
jgi:hypothetical protein